MRKPASPKQLEQRVKFMTSGQLSGMLGMLDYIQIHALDKLTDDSDILREAREHIQSARYHIEQLKQLTK